VLDQFWRCPNCGTGTAAGQPMRLTKPPTCNMGHPATEMEQCTAEGFKADFDATRDEEDAT
jgi:hypothetical protein